MLPKNTLILIANKKIAYESYMLVFPGDSIGVEYVNSSISFSRNYTQHDVMDKEVLKASESLISTLKKCKSPIIPQKFHKYCAFIRLIS